MGGRVGQDSLSERKVGRETVADPLEPWACVRRAHTCGPGAHNHSFFSFVRFLPLSCSQVRKFTQELRFFDTLFMATDFQFVDGIKGALRVDPPSRAPRNLPQMTDSATPLVRTSLM